MRISVVPRGERSRVWTYASPLLAILLTLVTAAIVFAALGKEPFEALRVMWLDPLLGKRGFSELFIKAAPLIMIAVGLSLGFRANVWNIGAEGQYIMGAIFATGVALFFYDVESFPVWLLMIPAGILGGMFWGAIPALLKTRFNASEILTSLMLTYVANLGLLYLVVGPWKDPDGYGFPQTRLLTAAASSPHLVPGTRIHLGVVAALIVVALGWFLLSKSLLGFKLKVVGQAPRAAAYAGFSTRALTWLSMLVGGGLAGLAGMFEVAGPIGQLTPALSTGYGFTAIIVAFLGRLHPVGVLFGGLVLALSYLGGEKAQIALGLPAAVTKINQGILLFYLLACDLLIRYRLCVSLAKKEAA
ncbi:ABC transporter permease [Dongia sp.]|uniref:ABC transporter permease n=1 Tax=Dongia sp. TaxID=1977262 RepID=UPI0035B0C82A